MLTLTATDRQARALREDHSLAQRRSGADVWEAPAIQSLRQWTQDVWTASWPAEQLLNATQELCLWRDVIDHDEVGATLLAPLAAAREARRAEQLLRRYHLNPEQAPLPREDVQAFLRWRRPLRQRMRREAWLSAQDLPAEVSRGLREGRIVAPPEICLAGFLDEPVPSERALLAVLESCGTVFHRAALPAAGSAPRAWRVADAETQFRAVAASIRQRLMAADPEMPAPRIVLALPDPEARRDFVETLFRPILAPWMSLPGDSVRPSPWRWDAGRPLSEQPLITAALDILALKRYDNPPATVSRVLLAASLWSDEQRLLTAQADLRLRDRGWPKLRFQRLLEAFPAALRPRFEQLDTALRTEPSRALPSDWVGHYRTRLEALGWPGDAPLDSTGFQVQREWERLLDRFVAMDGPLGRCNAAEALQWLRELARSAQFEPRVEYAQPILIVGIEDAAGLSCDALYLADVSADRFPGSPSVSPYLPLEQQRAAGVPGASPGLQLQQARRLALHLQALAPEVHLYAPEVDERGAESLPSPLFAESVQWQTLSVPAAACALEQQVRQGPLTVFAPEDPVPPADAGEIATLRADAGLFRAWFESPFFAFAVYRLGIHVLPQPGRGLDPRRQGVVAHRVLEDLWRELKDSAALAAVGADELGARIGDRLDLALSREMPESDYGRVAVALEHARLLDVLGQWLQHERKRVSPFVVEHLEAALNVNIGGLPLHLRIDRVDRVQTESGPCWLVLDYKTGRNADPKGWSAETLAEPQLPLYASHAAAADIGVPHVDGICFGHLKDGHPALVAMTNWCKRLIEPQQIDLSASWDDNLSAWRAQLGAAAQGFLGGQSALLNGISERSAYAYLLMLGDVAEADAE